MLPSMTKILCRLTTRSPSGCPAYFAGLTRRQVVLPHPPDFRALLLLQCAVGLRGRFSTPHVQVLRFPANLSLYLALDSPLWLRQTQAYKMITV